MPTFFAVHFADRMSRTANSIADLFIVPKLKESNVIELYSGRGNKLIKENDLLNQDFLKAIFNGDNLDRYSTGATLILINEMISLLGCDRYE